METLLIGAGAIGGIIAVLTKEKGYDVSILCHGEKTKAEIEKNGISLHGALGEHKQTFECFASFDELGERKFDICIIATKYAAMAQCAENVLPFLKKDSLVVGMQNGITTDELAQIVGQSRAVGCMLGFGATRESTTSINMTSKGEMYIGMAYNQHPDSLDYLKTMLESVLPVKISEDITRQQYSKLIINSCINATAAITGQVLGKIIDDKRARDLFLAIAREGMHVAKAMDINVPKYGKLLEYKMLMLMDNKPYNAMCKLVVRNVAKIAYADVKPSTLQSLEKGEKTEIDIFNGYFAQKGKEYGVPVPVNTKLTEMIHEIEDGKRPITPDNLVEFEGMI